MKTLEKNSTLNFQGQDFYTGIDVHKRNWKVTIRLNHMELKTFSMNPKPKELASHLKKNYPGGNYYSVYEAGFCGFWIHRQLVELGINNRVVNGADVPTTHKEKEQKRDPIDSRKLARELENQSLKGIYIPSEQQQALRSLARLYYQISRDQTRIKNRIKSFLHFNGIVLPRVDEMSHWSARFIDWLKTVPLKKEHDRYYLKQIIEHLQYKRQETLNVLRYMRASVRDNQIVFLLRSVCGIGFITAFTLYAELMDMRRFKNSDRLAAFIGFVPSVYGTDEKERKLGLSRRYSRYLRNRLIESAWVAVRSDPALTLSYSHCIKRMQKKKAIVRIARKLLNRIRYVWINEKIYVPGIIE